MDATADVRPRRLDLGFGGAWPVVFGWLALALPTFWTLKEQVWSEESGAHGPIVLFTGAWLIWRQWGDLQRDAAPGRAWATFGGLAVSLGLYVFGRAYDFIFLETLGLYGAALSMLHDRVGFAPMRRNWFPLLYLAFVIPLPGWAVDAATAPLKEFVSYVVTGGLQAVGLPIARQGVTLYVAQYQLLVEDACSGMNSLVGLIAISLFYIYLMRGASWRYSLALLAFVVPIAVIANMLRVATLVLLTYFFGDEVAQGFLHMAAGVFLFAAALLMIFGVDALLAWVAARRRGAPA